MKVEIEAILSSCTVHRRGNDVFVCAIEAVGSDERSSFHVLLGDQWYSYEEEPDWAAIGMAAGSADSELVIVAAAADGQTWELNPATRSERLSRLKPEGKHAGIVRLATIGSEVWACGMGRVVLRRDAASGQWIDHSAPRSSLAGASLADLSQLARSITGFSGLAALDSGEIIAVGWRGEIWVRGKDGVWRQEDSPTNANFNNVSVGPDGEVVIVGDRGGLVTGRPGAWQTIGFRNDFNLQGVCHFGGETFICTNFDLLRLVDGEVVAETRFDGDPPGTCMNLLAGTAHAFSQGERHIYRFDGTQWKSVL